MDKTKIKNFAVKARKQLVRSVRQSLANYGIDQDGVKKELSISTTTVKYYTNENFPLREKQIQWRQQILNRLNKEQEKDWKERLNEFIEEVAYTWFNQIIAIRFMEVNDYLPSHTRVLSSEEGRLEPDIITHSLEIEDYLGGYTNEEKELIKIALTSHKPDQMDNIFKILFIKQADMLSDLLPELFEKTSDYLKLLFTPQYNRGVVKELIDEIPEEYFDVSKSGQVSIIGWLYQYYISELHEQVINITGKKTIEKDDIPAATQLFTTDWIVKYMVDNSLGKYYLERHSDSKVGSKLKYLLPSGFDKIHDDKRLEEYKFIDNAMGSGHVLIYAFDVFMQLYLEQGYSSSEAVQLILGKNLFGLEIDKRAYQLAYFALMMKGRQYDRRIFSRKIKLNLYLFKDINLPSSFYKKLPQETASELKNAFSDFSNATEYGSVINVERNYDWKTLYRAVNQIKVDEKLDLYNIQRSKTEALNTLNILELLTNKFEVIVTNPPYLNKFDPTYKKYLKKYYPNYSKDLFSVFIYKNMNMLVDGGYAGFMTPFVWMFIKTYEPLRKIVINSAKIDSLVQLEYSAFEEATVPVDTFVLKKESIDKKGTYIRLSEFKGGMEIQSKKVLEAIDNPNCEYLYHIDQRNFDKIPGSPIAYWAPQSLIEDFKNGIPLGELVDAKQGLATADNKRFLRYWYEVDFNKICFEAHNTDEAMKSGKKWFPYNKGGSYRKWYGNYDYVVNWENNGYEIKHFTDKKGKQRSVVRNPDYYFKEAITWSLITSSRFSMRFREFGSIHDVAGMSAFSLDIDQLKLLLALGNSNVMTKLVSLLNPTINYQIGDIIRIPVINISQKDKQQIIAEADHAISLCKTDWNYKETSWNFTNMFLINDEAPLLKSSYNRWTETLKDNFGDLKDTERKINDHFNQLYGIETVDTKNYKSSIRSSNDQSNDRYAIKSLLSYFIGCILGRYSLDKNGLAYAGGQWDDSLYQSFMPNEDNLVLLTDRDYFGDNRDIINRFKEFLVQAFDKDHLTENMQFIAEILDSKKIKSGASNEQVIRDYFVSDFYKDHDKTYKNRPIYWQFNSGRNNGFKALMYVHRYTPNELAMCRDYLHQLQEAYTNTIKLDKDQENNSESAREKNKYRKDAANLNKKLAEIIKYDEDLQHRALAQVEIDLDDGIIVNHAKVQGEKKIFSKL